MTLEELLNDDGGLTPALHFRKASLASSRAAFKSIPRACGDVFSTRTVVG
jgi:hypothetical protein